MTAARAIAVVPTLSRDPGKLTSLTAGLEAVGLHPRLVVNGARLHAVLAERGIPHVDTGDNAGFGASIRAGIAGQAWDWLAIVNDDVTIDPQVLMPAVAGLLQRSGAGRVLAFFDPEELRPLPTPASIFASVSMAATVLSRARPQRSSIATPADGGYKSFSFVLISRGLWEELGGLDSRYVHTYEDSDFVRRALSAGADVLDLNPGGVAHPSSTTGRVHVERVLPVGVYSAGQYLTAIGVGQLRARGLLLLALLCRVVVVPVVRAPKGAHLRGILRAARAVATGRRPTLPPYEEC